MTTSTNLKKEVTLNIADTKIICNEFIISKDKHALTISMTIKNEGPANLLLSVNNFCLIQNNEACYAQHCYVNDGQQFEVISGWKSFTNDKSYTLITKYMLDANSSMYEFCYKTTNQQYSIIHINAQINDW